MPRKSLDNGLDAVRLAARQPLKAIRGYPAARITASRGPIVNGTVE